jgi:peptidyl-prolyl cis-trans isomerase D
MESMRNAAKSWVAKLLIGLLVISFAVWGIKDVFTGYRANALVTVGKQEVSANQFADQFNRVLQSVSQQTGKAMTPDEARKLGLDRTVLNTLIQQAALDDQARTLRLSIGDNEIAQAIADNKTFQGPDGKFSPDALRNFLQRAGIPESLFLAEQKNERLRSAVTNAVSAGLEPPKSLVEALTRHRVEERDARYFVVSVGDSDVPPATEDEIKKQYESNPDAYTAPEYRSIAIMKAEPADIVPKLTVSDEELQAGYEKYKLDYFTPETRTVLQLTFSSVDEANAAKQKLSSGTDFLALAKERGATENDITFANKAKSDFLDPAIAEVAFSAPLNKVSDPVTGGLAIALLKVTDIKPEKQATLNDVRDKLAERLKFERAHEEVQSVFDAVENERNNQVKFEEIASKSGIPFIMVPAVSRSGEDKDGKSVDLPHKNELLQAAFDSDAGVENEALTLDEGFVWYEVREVIPSAIRPIESVKERVTADVLGKKFRDVVSEKAKALVSRAENGMTLDALAQEAGQPVKEATGLKRNETSADFDTAAVTALFGVAENGATWSLEGDGRSARIIQSKAVMAPPFDPASETAKQIAEAVKEGIQSDLPQIYLGALGSAKGAQINDQLWRQISGNTTAP